MENADRQNAISYITHVSWQGSRLGLSRMEELLGRMGNPQEKLKYIHVAGTNGKGSVSALLAGALTSAGYTTGLFTSPYITQFNERVQVNGQPIPDDELVKITRQVQQYADAMEDHPTEFELITVVALVYFLACGCDIVVLEVGLGGRLDSTNIIPPPEVAVITAIDFDHVAELGDTLEKIAAEKAGIIKPGSLVVLYHQSPQVEAVIAEKCRQCKVPLRITQPGQLVAKEDSLQGQLFDYGTQKDIRIRLLGGFQLENAATALTVLEILAEKGFAVSEEALRSGFAKVHWPARFEVVHQNPTVIVDGGHNIQCVEALLGNLARYFPGKKITFVVGVMADKNYEAMFPLILPVAKQIVAVTPDNPRALAAKALAEYFTKQGFAPVTAFNSVADGVNSVYKTALNEEVICVFGSFYMAGTVRKMFLA